MCGGWGYGCILVVSPLRSHVRWQHKDFAEPRAQTVLVGSVFDCNKTPKIHVEK